MFAVLLLVLRLLCSAHGEDMYAVDDKPCYWQTVCDLL